MNYNKFFKSKKVLITVHTGFKGTWLTLWMIKSGAKIHSISNENNTLYNKYKIKFNNNELVDSHYLD